MDTLVRATDGFAGSVVPAAGRHRLSGPFRRRPRWLAGYSAFEAENVDALVRATDGFA
ncbi:hypothetical protein [Stenotrophomonas pavanii]|uniref:hypothetical protein n=1 Tax=Stenotrophomonas pavanii TaxID=487698 RepID=UPI0039C71422